jgi:N-glycosidase YbiA
MLNPTIDNFTGEYRFLSNFYPSQIRYEGITFAAVEHAFQAAKTHERSERLRIASSRSPGAAKGLGRQVKLRKDWESVKVEIMRQLVEKKFTVHQDLRNRLLATNDAELIEGNTWNDCFWGMCNGRGKNHLGRILMDIRAGFLVRSQDRTLRSRIQRKHVAQSRNG